MPPCLLYSELVAQYNMRNLWSCQEWIDYIDSPSKGHNPNRNFPRG